MAVFRDSLCLAGARHPKTAGAEQVSAAESEEVMTTAIHTVKLTLQ